jgi:hypothetical protein
MFYPKFLNNLWQPAGDNLWPTHMTNQNYRMWFHKQCDYMLEFQANMKINDSILLWKWPRNIFNVENNAYETLVLA